MGGKALAQGLKSQLTASLLMLKDCIDRCPQEEWHERHDDYPFSQVVFHALFDCDLNMCEDEKELKSQQIHEEHKEEFGNYEELEGRIAAKVYAQEFIKKYYLHCLEKITVALDQKTNDELLISGSDYYRTMTKMERYVNCIRHTQHHAAQLGLRLQFVTREEMEWVGRCDA